MWLWLLIPAALVLLVLYGALTAGSRDDEAAGRDDR